VSRYRPKPSSAYAKKAKRKLPARKPSKPKAAKRTASRPKPAEAKPPEPETVEIPMEARAEKPPAPIAEAPVMAPPPKPPEPEGERPKAKPKVEVAPLSEEEMEMARMVPVPEEGPIPTPYIDWDQVPPHAVVRGGVHYVDYPVRGAPRGMLPELRRLFAMNRKYGSRMPVNVLIQGPPGVGKSELVKKFAEEAGLPYWQVIGREGITSAELLGGLKMERGTTKWVEGIIPKAVRTGGILHIDEANVIDPAILMRLDELLDNKRQLNLYDETGEIIRAHPDLFIIFTVNPPTYEGVKPLPPPILNRLSKRYYLDYPDEETELRIIEQKLRSMGISEDQFRVERGAPKGSLAQEIADYHKLIRRLRENDMIEMKPSMRELVSFVQELAEGEDWNSAFWRSLGNVYTPEEKSAIDDALTYIGRK
jgi:MoxR-like ATPase